MRKKEYPEASVTFVTIPEKTSLTITYIRNKLGIFGQIHRSVTQSSSRKMRKFLFRTKIHFPGRILKDRTLPPRIKKRADLGRWLLWLELLLTPHCLRTVWHVSLPITYQRSCRCVYFPRCFFTLVWVVLIQATLKVLSMTDVKAAFRVFYNVNNIHI